MDGTAMDGTAIWVSVVTKGGIVALGVLVLPPPAPRRAPAPVIDLAAYRRRAPAHREAA